MRTSIKGFDEACMMLRTAVIELFVQRVEMKSKGRRAGRALLREAEDVRQAFVPEALDLRSGEDRSGSLTLSPNALSHASQAARAPVVMTSLA